MITELGRIDFEAYRQSFAVESTPSFFLQRLSIGMLREKLFLIDLKWSANEDNIEGKHCWLIKNKLHSNKFIQKFNKKQPLP